MAAYPAHISLPTKARMEALDVLTWAWTGNNGFIYSLTSLAEAYTFSSIECLFPSHCAVPAPFTQEECRELMTLIRSFGGTDHISFFFLH